MTKSVTKNDSRIHDTLALCMLRILKRRPSSNNPNRLVNSLEAGIWRQILNIHVFLSSTSIFSNNSEEFASELPEKCEEMFPRNYMYVTV